VRLREFDGGLDERLASISGVGHASLAPAWLIRAGSRVPVE
jgi:hypothetical protein